MRTQYVILALAMLTGCGSRTTDVTRIELSECQVVELDENNRLVSISDVPCAEIGEYKIISEIKHGFVVRSGYKGFK